MSTPSAFDAALSRANSDGWIEVTYSELQWFAEQYRLHYYARDGVVTMPFDQFCTEQDLENWRQLFAWWPRVPRRSAPVPFQPLLTLMLDAQHGAPTLPPVTFAQALRLHWERAVAWCQQHGVSPADPNETSEERGKRLNRERVSAWRSKQKAMLEDPDAVVTAKQAQERAVDAVKSQFAPQLEQADRLVAEGHAWFLKVSRDRKALREAYKAALEGARASPGAAHDNGPVARPAAPVDDAPGATAPALPE